MSEASFNPGFRKFVAIRFHVNQSRRDDIKMLSPLARVNLFSSCNFAGMHVGDPSLSGQRIETRQSENETSWWWSREEQATADRLWGGEARPSGMPKRGIEDIDEGRVSADQEKDVMVSRDSDR